MDTSLGNTVIETTDCANCAGSAVDTSGPGLSAAADAVSGSLKSPSSAYSGVKGTATLCIYGTGGGYSNVPNNLNVGAMPCVQTLPVHFADTVATPNPNAVAYLGAALANGADKDDNTPDAGDSFINAYTTANKMDASTKLFALALRSDDGDGSDPAKTQSFMDLGTTTSDAVDPALTKATIKMDETDFYWKTDLKGVGIGSYDDSKYGLAESKITVETAQQCLYVPETYYPFMYEQLTYSGTGSFTTADGETIVDCSNGKNMEDIMLLMNDQWVQI